MTRTTTTRTVRAGATLAVLLSTAGLVGVASAAGESASTETVVAIPSDR